MSCFLREIGILDFKALEIFEKAERLPRSCNRQDVRLLNNRYSKPFTRNSWALRKKLKMRLKT